MGFSFVPATIAPAAHAFLILEIKSLMPNAAIYAAVASPAPFELIVLKSGGTISIVPSKLISLAGKLEEVNKMYFTIFESIKLLASSTLISSLLTIKKYKLYSIGY